MVASCGPCSEAYLFHFSEFLKLPYATTLALWVLGWMDFHTPIKLRESQERKTRNTSVPQILSRALRLDQILS